MVGLDCWTEMGKVDYVCKRWRVVLTTMVMAMIELLVV
jgi:hypothetical protein